jgi:hypothetical protein
MSQLSSCKFAPALLAGLVLSAMPMFAQAPAEGPVPTTALVMVQSKSGAPLDPAMLKLQVNRHEAPITSVAPVAAPAAQVAILIDDGLRFTFSSNIPDFTDFINRLPAGTKVMVGYMRNGEVQAASGFSDNHAAIAAQLRIPISSAGVDASPYFCLSEFAKHWPSNSPGARFVLMISNGVDPYNGRPSIMNQDSPYVQAAQEDAQRAGIAVYSIYYPETGLRGGRGSFSGQSYLAQVAEATGGAPYLNQFGKAIAESYMVTFNVNASGNKRDSLAQIKLTSSQPGVKIHAPQNVHPGVDLQ